MTAEEVRTFRHALPPERRPQTPQELAHALVHAGRLTDYQTAAVFQGKTKGLVLGDYVVLEEIGHGGMGQVYRAWHRTMERAVALKVLPPKAIQSQEAVERFRREVKAAARLTHPNIVTAYDAREHEGTHYLVMEYVDGADLAQLLADRGPLAIDEAVGYVIQAARGLEYAHRQGIVHRDVKPANLLLDQEGTVKILDMGLARIEQRADPYAATAPAGPAGPDALTQSGQVMGTYDYMAPEQAQDTHRVDHRADVYSLGCTLYRLLTGRKPYHADTPVKILLAHCQEPIPSLCQVREDVSPQLDAVFQKMLAKDPAERQPSMGEVIAELERCIRPAPPVSHPPSALEQPATASSSSSDSALKTFLRSVSKTATATRPQQAGAAEETIHLQREERTGALAAKRPPVHASKQKTAVLAGVGVAGLVVIVVGVFAVLRPGPSPQKPGMVTRPDKTQTATPGQAESYLVLRWPEAERAGATLEIDGRLSDLAGSAVQSTPNEVKIAVSAGLHKVWIARRGFEPVEERFMAVYGETYTVYPVWQAAPTLVGEIEPKPAAAEPSGVAASPPSSVPEPEPKATEALPLDSEVAKRLEAEARYAEAIEPIEKLIAAWDFRAASAELEKVQFEEADFAARAAAWGESIHRLADLKTRIIAKINAAEPPLKKTDLMIRGTGGELTRADQNGITARLVGGRIETLAWADVGPQAIEELVGLARGLAPFLSQTKKVPDPLPESEAADHLAAGVLALASDDPTSAEKLFEQARSLGADIGPHLAPLASSAFAEAQELLAAAKFSETEALLANIEAKYAATGWFASSQPALAAARAQAQASIYEAEAEQLYAEAAELFKEEQLFDVKPPVEKLRTGYANSQAVTETARSPSFTELEEAVAQLGQFLTVRQDGQGDFTSIQASIDAAPPDSLIEIQDNGPYNEKIVIPEGKRGMTIRGRKSCWPTITSVGSITSFAVLVNVEAQGTTLNGLVLNHSGAAGNAPACLQIAQHKASLRIRSSMLIGCTWTDYWRNMELDTCIVTRWAFPQHDFVARNCIWLHTPHGIKSGNKFENVLFVKGFQNPCGACDFLSCTINGRLTLQAGDASLVNCIVSSVESPGPSPRIEHCNVFGIPPLYIDQAKPGEGCFSAPPMFVNPEGLDYRLLPTSPCIGRASDGGDIGCRYTPEMIEMCQKALELRAKGIIKF